MRKASYFATFFVVAFILALATGQYHDNQMGLPALIVLHISVSEHPLFAEARLVHASYYCKM